MNKFKFLNSENKCMIPNIENHPTKNQLIRQ
jgi:hypothetical protein